MFFVCFLFCICAFYDYNTTGFLMKVRGTKSVPGSRHQTVSRQNRSRTHFEYLENYANYCTQINPAKNKGAILVGSRRMEDLFSLQN